jgi:integrase/recombinase XerD
VTISEAFARFDLEQLKLQSKSEKTRRNYRSTLSSFIKACSDIPITLVSYEHIIRWKVYMDSIGNKSSSIASNLSKMREVLKYLKKHGYNVLDHRDIELPRVVSANRTYLDHKEIEKIIQTASNLRDRALFAALWSSGCRISEVLAVDRDQIQVDKAFVLGKNSKTITVRLDGALSYIHEYLASRKDHLPPLFISGQYRRLTVSRVEQILHQVSAEAGIDKIVTPHVFRHSWATNLLENGADIRTVQNLLHHESISTTMIYTHVSQRREDESYKRFHTK